MPEKEAKHAKRFSRLSLITGSHMSNTNDCRAEAVIRRAAHWIVAEAKARRSEVI